MPIANIFSLFGTRHPSTPRKGGTLSQLHGSRSSEHPAIHFFGTSSLGYGGVKTLKKKKKANLVAVPENLLGWPKTLSYLATETQKHIKLLFSLPYQSLSMD